MSPCKLEKEFGEHIVTVKLSGSLVYEDVMDVSQQIKNLLAHEWKKIILDMSEITHVNSKGIGVLISINVACTKNNAEFIIFNPSEVVSKLLKVTKLERVFTIYSGPIDVAAKLFS